MASEQLQQFGEQEAQLAALRWQLSQLQQVYTVTDGLLNQTRDDLDKVNAEVDGLREANGEAPAGAASALRSWQRAMFQRACRMPAAVLARRLRVRTSSGAPTPAPLATLPTQPPATWSCPTWAPGWRTPRRRWRRASWPLPHARRSGPACRRRMWSARPTSSPQVQGGLEQQRLGLRAGDCW